MGAAHPMGAFEFALETRRRTRWRVFERRVARSKDMKCAAFTGALLWLVLGCAEEPAPRFDAPLASGVLMLPLGANQRFDARLSAGGLLAAMEGHGALGVEADAVGAEIVLAHLPRGAYRAAILGDGVSAYDALATAGHSVVVGSGFVSVFNPVRPLGLLQLQGDVMSDAAPHGYSRVLGAKDDDLRVIPREDFHPGLFDSAIQVGPGIVQEGKLDILQRERKLPPHIRAFVATCSDRWLAGVAHAPMHLYDLGERLLGLLRGESTALRRSGESLRRPRSVAGHPQRGWPEHGLLRRAHIAEGIHHRLHAASARRAVTAATCGRLCS